MGEQNDKIIEKVIVEFNDFETNITTRHNRYDVHWDVLASVMIERGIQAGALFTALVAGTVTSAYIIQRWVI